MGSPDERTAEQFYQPVDQTAISEGDFASAGEVNADYGYIVLRTRMEPEQMENALRATVHRIDPQLPLYHIQTMEHAIDGSEAPRRFNTILISCFALVAVLLSVLGIYSIIAFPSPCANRKWLSAWRWAVSVRGCSRSSLFGRKTGGGGLCLRLAGRLGCVPPAAFFPVSVSPFDPVVLTLPPSPCCCWRSWLLHCQPGALPKRIPCWPYEANRKFSCTLKKQLPKVTFS